MLKTEDTNVRVTDENYSPEWTESFLTKERQGEVGTPFQTRKSVRKEKCQALEFTLLKQTAQIFRLDKKEIARAHQSMFGESGHSFDALNKAYSPPFPAKIIIAKPNKKKEERLTISRLMQCPQKTWLFKEYFRHRNLTPEECPLILAGHHPCLRTFLAVTDIDIEYDINCFIFKTYETYEDGSPPNEHDLIITGFRQLLITLKRQKVWEPELDAWM